MLSKNQTLLSIGNKNVTNVFRSHQIENIYMQQILVTCNFEVWIWSVSLQSQKRLEALNHIKGRHDGVNHECGHVDFEVHKKPPFNKERIHWIMVDRSYQYGFYVWHKGSIKHHIELIHKVFTFWRGLTNPVLFQGLLYKIIH